MSDPGGPVVNGGSTGTTATTGSRRPRGRVTGFRIAAVLTGLLLLLAGVQALIAPWSLPTDTGDAHAEAHRWFITVAGTADAVGAVAILALAIRPTLTLLAVDILVGIAIAALVNLPVSPWFGVILLIMAPMLVLYPYWPSVRHVGRWWSAPIKPLLWLGIATSAVVVVVGSLSFVRQFTAHDSAAAANWWADYAEHLVGLGVVLLFAATGLPGWRVLATAASAAWIYLGLVAIYVLPGQIASWGRPYGLLSVMLGTALAITVALQRDQSPIVTSPDS